MGRFARILVAAVLLAGAASSHAEELGWTLLNGLATDIAVGPLGDAWVVGAVGEAGGYGIFRFDGANWGKVAGGATRISVGPAGPWIVNNAGLIWRLTSAGWQQMPGAARDIGVGADGTVWVVGTIATTGGFKLYRWNGTRNAWDAMPGGGVAVAVDPKGNAWVVSAQGALSRWNGSGFEQVRASETIDVGIGANGSVLVIGNRVILEWTGGGWKVRGRTPSWIVDGTRIAVDSLGYPWVVAHEQNIWTANKAARGGASVPVHVKNLTPSSVVFLVSEVDGRSATHQSACLAPNAEVTWGVPVQQRYAVQIASGKSCDPSDCCTVVEQAGVVATYSAYYKEVRVDARTGMFPYAH